MQSVTIEVATPQLMKALGAAVTAVLRPGDVVVLAGPLGAGKTTFVQGAAQELGVVEAVTSPTFVMARVHRGAVGNMVHVDAYRLAHPRDFHALDLDDEIESAITFVEWGQHVIESDALTITIDRGREDDVRVVTLPAKLSSVAAVVAK